MSIVQESQGLLTEEKMCVVVHGMALTGTIWTAKEIHYGIRLEPKTIKQIFVSHTNIVNSTNEWKGEETFYLENFQKPNRYFPLLNVEFSFPDLEIHCQRKKKQLYRETWQYSFSQKMKVAIISFKSYWDNVCTLDTIWQEQHFNSAVFFSK